MTPSNPAPTRHYARSWCWAISRRLISAYPRAADIVLKNLDITEKEHVNYLERGDEVFGQTRQLMHDVYNKTPNHGEDGTVFEFYPFLRQMAEEHGYKRIVLRLDSVRSRANN